MVVFDESDSLAHYGVKMRSGRYPWGSGGTQLSEAQDFQSALNALRSGNGPVKMTNAQIADAFELTTTELIANIASSGLITKRAQIVQAETLARSGSGASAIAKEMGINESSVRGLLQPQANRKAQQLDDIVSIVRQRVDQDKYIDVGKGAEHYLKIAKTKLDVALSMMETEGYVVVSILQPQATNAHDTRVRVIAAPGETWQSVTNNKDKIRGIEAFSNDQGHNYQLAQEPLRLNPARLDIKYGAQGGGKEDGTIYIRPGVKDLSMDGNSYSQVRIQVGKGHFIKGMAVMKDGLPPGVDVQFNTKKEDTGTKTDALKPVVADSAPIERFGAIFAQITDRTTGKVTSHLNIVNNEDDWDSWSKSLATQMLSKQKPDFVKRQLDVTYASKKQQLDEILSLTNPVVKKELLKSYAEDMDASSVHLKAAALPRQKTHVILPVGSLKDNEVYAPGYKDGERLVLIRFPHGGKFEIPELINNTRNKDARAIMNPATTRAAIGINSKVAERLSGADFDGDTVVVIPNTRGRVQSEPALDKLKGFDPQEAYMGRDPKTKEMYPGVQPMKTTQTEMGKISNLITDMTIGGATHDELARAVRHSMVVIDAEKHGLDYKRSAKDNSIATLTKRYQPGRYAGASTIISRTKKETPILDYKRRPEAEGGGTDKVTGEAIYIPTGKLKPLRIVDKVTGEVTWGQQPKMTRVAKGSRLPGTGITDAAQLVGASGNPVEKYYADYSNRVRQLANDARLAEINIANPTINHSAKAVYSAEVTSLRAKLKDAQMNSPRERQAQAVASVIIKVKRDANPNMSKEQLKRVKVNAIHDARERTGAKPKRVVITDGEWEAIQSGAVASSLLREILTKADAKRVKELAQPRTDLKMQPHNVAYAKSLISNGNYTREEVASLLGVSVSTLDRSIK